jgi:hypothetical protein
MTQNWLFGLETELASVGGFEPYQGSVFRRENIAGFFTMQELEIGRLSSLHGVSLCWSYRKSYGIVDPQSPEKLTMVFEVTGENGNLECSYELADGVMKASALVNPPAASGGQYSFDPRRLCSLLYRHDAVVQSKFGEFLRGYHDL